MVGIVTIEACVAVLWPETVRRRGIKTFITWPALKSWAGQGALLLVIWFVITSWQQKDLLADAVTAPDLRLVSLEGEVMGTGRREAEKTLVYFFAPWCSVCKFSIDNLEALRQRRSEQELAIYLVALSYQSRQEVVDFVAEHQLSVPVLLGNEQTMRDFNIQAFPTYYVLDEQLKVESKSVGYSSEIGLRQRT